MAKANVSTDRARWGQNPDHVKALVEGMISCLELKDELDANFILKNQILAKRYSHSQITTKMNSIFVSYQTPEALRGYLASLSKPRNTASESKKRLQNAKLRGANKMMESLNQFGISYSDGDDADFSPSPYANDDDFDDEVREVFGPTKKKFCVSDMRFPGGSSSIAAPVFIPPNNASMSPHSGVARVTENVIPPPTFEVAWFRSFNKVLCIVKRIPLGAEITRKMDTRTLEVSLKFKWVDDVEIQAWLSQLVPPVQATTTMKEITITIPFPADAMPGIPTVVQGAPDGCFGLEYLSKTVSQPEAQSVDF